MILDSAVYVDGRREKVPDSLAGVYAVCRERRGLAWVDLHEPTAAEFYSVVREFEPHHLALADANRPHQRPKVERYDGDLTFTVLKTARYLDKTEAVEVGEIRIFAGPDFIVTVSLGDAAVVREVRRCSEDDPGLLSKGPMAILHEVLHRVVEGYTPVVEGLENDIEEIEEEVFGGTPGVSRRIYELYRETIQFQRATKPLSDVIGRLMEGPDHKTRRNLHDVENRVLRVTEQVEDFRELLSSILSVNLTLVSINQNDQTKKISAWAAILIVPTLIAGVYGMNFEYMPELDWTLGYPFALALMAVIALLLYRAFKRSGWL